MASHNPRHEGESAYSGRLRLASWMELAIGSVWVLAAGALTVTAIIATLTNPPPVIQTGLTPPPGVTPPPGQPPPTPAPSGVPVLGAIVWLPLLGLIGGGPSVLVGILLRRSYRTRSAGRAAMVTAFVSACLFLGLIGAVLVLSMIQPGSGAPIDVDFLVLGILIGLTGIIHLLAGLLVALRGHHPGLPRLQATPPPPSVHSGA